LYELIEVAGSFLKSKGATCIYDVLIWVRVRLYISTRWRDGDEAKENLVIAIVPSRHRHRSIVFRSMELWSDIINLTLSGFQRYVIKICD